jgi:predicted DNA-binding transcriptional regulator AlpA
VSKKKRGPGKRVEPVFVTKSQCAQMMGVGNTATIDAWIAEGTFPPPHSRPGRRFAIWLRKHGEAYVETGEWPREAWPKWHDRGPRRRGRNVADEPEAVGSDLECPRAWMPTEGKPANRMTIRARSHPQFMC